MYIKQDFRWNFPISRLAALQNAGDLSQVFTDAVFENNILTRDYVLELKLILFFKFYIFNYFYPITYSIWLFSYWQSFPYFRITKWRSLSQAGFRHELYLTLFASILTHLGKRNALIIFVGNPHGNIRDVVRKREIRKYVVRMWTGLNCSEIVLHGEISLWRH